MYEDSGIPVTRHLRSRQMDNSDEIVSDCAAKEILRGTYSSNTDSGLGMEKEDDLIARDGSTFSSSSIASTTRTDRPHHPYHQLMSIRFDSGTDSGFESYRSERLTSSDISSWRNSSDLIVPLSPTEEQASPTPLSDRVAERLDQLHIGTSDTNRSSSSSSYYYCRLGEEEEEDEETDTIKANSDGDTILHIAIIHGLTQLAWNIVHHYPREHLWWMVNSQNYLLQTPLHLAVITRQPDLVRALVLAGALLEIRDRRGNTALHLACERGDSTCAFKILNPINELKEMNLPYEGMEIHRQDLELINYEGQTCMHLSTLSQDPKLICLLKDFGADVNAPECKSGRSPLHYAVEIQNLIVIKCLLKECHASTESRTFAGLTPIQFAYSRSQKLVDLLLKSGAQNVGVPPSDSESDSSSDELTKMETFDDDSELDIHINGRPLKCF